jgi:hypothetical protein
VQAKQPGPTMLTKPVDLNVDFAEALGESPLPLRAPAERRAERRLDALPERDGGRGHLGDRRAGAGDVGPIRTYEKGSMGPEASDALVREYGGWIEPLAPPSDRSA